MNPYEPPTDAEFVPDAEVKASVATPLPMPGLGLSLLLAVVNLVAQIVVSIAVAVVVAAVLTIVHGGVEKLNSMQDQLQVAVFPAATFATVVTAVAIAVALYRRDVARCVAWRSCSATQWGLTLAFVIPLAVVTSEFMNFAAEVWTTIAPAWLLAFRESQSAGFGLLADAPVWLMLLAGSLFPAIGEELLCRGVISRGLTSRYGVLLGGFLAAAIFGAMHMEPVHAFGAFLLGIGLQYVFSTTKSLAAAMAVHGLNNALAFFLMRYSSEWSLPGLSEFNSEEVTHTPWPLFLAACVALANLSYLFYQTRTKWQLPDGSEWDPGYASAEMPSLSAGACPKHAPANLFVLAIAGLSYLAMLRMLIVAGSG